MNPPTEIFTVSGVTTDVLYARVAGLNGLRSILGSESEELWRQQSASYQLAQVEGEPDEDGEPTVENAVRYEITWVRMPVEVEA